MAPDTALRTGRVRRRPHVHFRWSWLAGAIAAVVFVAVVPSMIADPPKISRLTLVNPTPYPVDVQVTAALPDGWMELGTAQPGTTTVVQDVIDQGSTWLFRFTTDGYDGGQLQLGRDDLVGSRWRVTISASVGDRLAHEGATPSPTLSHT